MAPPVWALGAANLALLMGAGNPGLAQASTHTLGMRPLYRDKTYIPWHPHPPWPLHSYQLTPDDDDLLST